MQVDSNKVISVSYKLHSSKEGNDPVFVEETNQENPLVFLFGSGQLIPEFENNLKGLSPGNSFEFRISAENAYGNMDDEALVKVSSDMFKVDGVLDLEIMRTGNTVPLLDRDGNQLLAKIVSIDGDDVMLDFNHPLAGQDLHFSGEVISVRDASAEEIDHGHAHDGNSHHH